MDLYSKFVQLVIFCCLIWFLFRKVMFNFIIFGSVV